MKKGNYVVVIEVGDGPNLWFLTEGEYEFPYRFTTAKQAREAAEAMHWANAWVWWVVQLTVDGKVRYGMDVK